MRSIRPCGHYGHVVREARCRSLGDVFYQTITANTACPHCLFLCPLSFQVEFIGGKRTVVVHALCDLIVTPKQQIYGLCAVVVAFAMRSSGGDGVILPSKDHIVRLEKLKCYLS
jgi:hypothetical protein